MKLFSKKKEKPFDYYDYEFRDVGVYEYYTIELMEWVANENDPLLLAITSIKLDEHIWPAYLPEKPFDEKKIRETKESFAIYLDFESAFSHDIGRKAEYLYPQICHRIRMAPKAREKLYNRYVK